MSALDILKGIFVLTSIASFSACGKSQFIKSAQLGAHTSGGDEYAELIATVDSQQLILPEIQFPIIDIRHPGLSFGNIGLKPSLDGKTTELSIDLDLSQILHLPKAGENASLPNGTGLPMSGIDPSQVMMFNIGGGGSRVYVEMDTLNKKAMLGAALVISQFNIGAVADLFIPFQGTGFLGTAGVFTGAQFGQSGFGIFADLSPLLTNQLTNQLTAQMTGQMTTAVARVQSFSSTTNATAQFLSVQPSSRNNLKIQRMLYDLNNSGRALNVR